MVALNVVLAHLFAQFPALLKAKLNTKLAMLASIAVLANPFVLQALSLLNNRLYTYKPLCVMHSGFLCVFVVF